ncbi:uncharacterized protein J3D65DRAFT_252808 [Phyllosticta citribraziliensis]|uniref:Secreted protein n=1 Tax=Phyllosticta citribraziliensis TaxID=989973 RepID=A0ABR1M1G6_9PEZI
MHILFSFHLHLLLCPLVMCHLLYAKRVYLVGLLLFIVAFFCLSMPLRTPLATNFAICRGEAYICELRAWLQGALLCKRHYDHWIGLLD